MPARSEPSTGGRGLSVRQLALIFFGAVAVCAVFFALGYVVGNNQAASGAVPSVEQVPTRAEIPPTVNPPAESPQDAAPASSSNTQSSTVIEQNLKAQSAAAAPSPAAEIPAHAAARPASYNRVVPRASAPHGIMIQVAASHTKRAAQSLAGQLKSHGYPAVLVAARGAHIYRVQVGPFASSQQATKVLHALSRRGFRPFIKEE
jgi:cell division protein FtsN